MRGDRKRRARWRGRIAGRAAGVVRCGAGARANVGRCAKPEPSHCAAKRRIVVKHNPTTAKMLIASDSVDDAAQIVKQLMVDHQQIRGSTNAEFAVADFEEFMPDVLVLAFDSIEKAERYSLGLYRQS